MMLTMKLMVGALGYMVSAGPLERSETKVRHGAVSHANVTNPRRNPEHQGLSELL